MSGRERTLEDLVDQAGDAASEASEPGQGTGEYIQQTVELLDKRGLLEPMLFGPDGAQELKEQSEPAGGDGDGEGGGAPDLDADTLAAAGRSIMDQLGEDVTVAEVVAICEDNPRLVNEQLEDHL